MSPVQSIPAVTPIEERGYAHPEVLVSTDWVAQHLDDPKVRLVESNEDLLLYDSGTFPGAVKIDWTNDLNDPVVARLPRPRPAAGAAPVKGHQQRHDDRPVRRQEQLVGHLRPLGAAAVRRRRT